MPTYKKDATEFLVAVSQGKNQQVKTTVPKPLFDRLADQAELRGEFVLQRTCLVFIPY